jgi:mannose-6-phosphate isomerase-like protein (cupin superfamily)
MSVFSINIEKDTLKNNNYRKVINTNTKQQLVLMSLEPDEYIPIENHKHTSQFFRIESGVGVVEIGNPVKKKIKIKDGVSVTIPPNTIHYIKNTSKKEQLKLYTIYSPPEHKHGKINKRQPKKEFILKKSLY